MSNSKTSKSKRAKNPDPQNPDATTPDAPAKESTVKKDRTTRPGKKVMSLVVDEKWAARVALCAKAEGRSQTDFIVEAVSKNLRSRLAAALDALKAEVE